MCVECGVYGMGCGVHALPLSSLSVMCRGLCWTHTSGMMVGPSGSLLSPSRTMFSAPTASRDTASLPADGLSGLKSHLPWTRWPLSVGTAHRGPGLLPR